MPTIRLPQTPDVQQAAYQGAAPADTSAKYRGQQALAGGIANVGGAMGEFAERSARIKAEADVVRARLAMEKTQADIQADLEANPNPREWEQTAEKRLQEAAGSIFTSAEGATFSPQVKRQLEQDFQTFAQRTTLTVRNQAQRQQNTENDAAFVAAQASAIAAGDVEQGLGYVDTRERLGLISTQRATIEREAVRYGVDRQMAARAINEDPHAAIELLEEQTDGGNYRHFKHLSETDRITALRSAKTARETLRAETAQGFAEDIYSGGLRAFGIDKRIDEAVEDQRILPSQGNNLKRLARGERSPQEQAGEASQLWQAALDLDRSAPDWKETEMQIRAAAAALDPTVRTPIIEALGQSTTGETSAIVSNAFALLQRDYAAETETWTKAEIDAMERGERKAAGRPKPGDYKNPTKGPMASESLFRRQMALREFIAKNPKAKPEDILRERARLTATDQQRSLADLLIADLTGAVP